MPSVVMLSIIMLNVVALNIAAAEGKGNCKITARLNETWEHYIFIYL
jgi:hypothetical protein